MNDHFFDQPILNSPYEPPARHWELDEDGQPTHKIINSRRPVRFITPIPKPRSGKFAGNQRELVFDEGLGLSTDQQQYDHTALINAVRREVDKWRAISDPNRWQVTPETARLLRHWRNHHFSDIRPFFCQIEAAETAIWLTEVAPKKGSIGRRFLEHLSGANEESNPGLNRLALKLATGSGKTTVMAMLIAWQTINAIRRPQSKNYSKGFLVVTPGITIKDRLRVLQPNDPDNYYERHELVPKQLMPDIKKAQIVITNYHAFKLRENFQLSRVGNAFLKGRDPALQSLETDGQMLRRAMPALLGLRNILVINDEAHHCYREKPDKSEEGELPPGEIDEATENSNAARLWISGIESVDKLLGVNRVLDLSATPFFLRGSGYAEGTLFPWTLCDFSLMDAIECGIVKLPRVPVADNIPGSEMPRFRNLWQHIGQDMPKTGRRRAGILDPLKLPLELQTALQALYGHYEQTFKAMGSAGISVPPCFIIVCSNTASSKLVYDYVSGFHRDESGTRRFNQGRLKLFRNFDESGNRLPRPRTLLIDSQQLESGEALDPNFRRIAAPEIERFRREIIERTGDRQSADNITDQDLLREVMNTVGKIGRLGESIRCVVSVSMLTEGWDANNVSHVLGVRAFGTQLLCEQVVGRALRRQSYTLRENGLFDVEYADVLGIPFDFTAKPTVVKPVKLLETVHVRAVRPERDALEIRFPRVAGYRVELPNEELKATFNEDSILELHPRLVGPSVTTNQGIIGEGVDLNLVHTNGVRLSTVIFHLTQQLLLTKWRDPGEAPKLHLFGQLKRITQEWVDKCLICSGGTYPAQLMYQELADVACERITAGITRAESDRRPIKAVIDPYNPSGSTADVSFTTSNENRYRTDPRRCHLNWAILDWGWEKEFCRVVESHPNVIAYAKNDRLGLEVPYQFGSESRVYLPDFIVVLDDGQGNGDPLNLVVEIKGYRRENAKDKKATMENLWIRGVNNDGRFGRWAFAELRDPDQFGANIDAMLEREVGDLLESAIGSRSHRS